MRLCNCPNFPLVSQDKYHAPSPGAASCADDFCGAPPLLDRGDKLLHSPRHHTEPCLSSMMISHNGEEWLARYNPLCAIAYCCERVPDLLFPLLDPRNERRRGVVRHSGIDKRPFLAKPQRQYSTLGWHAPPENNRFTSPNTRKIQAAVPGIHLIFDVACDILCPLPDEDTRESDHQCR